MDPVRGLMGCVFRAVYTGTRPGVSPAIRAGKGWRGRRELAPRCSATQLGACSCGVMIRHIVVIPSSEPQPPQPPPPSRFKQVARIFCWVTFSRTLAVAMSERAGAAERRRERRLRSWLRHERMTVAMALAEQLHHSINRVERDEALRRQTTRASEEEVENVTHSSPRALKTPPPGERPGILAEPGPQRE